VKYLQNYIEEAQTALFKKLGCFFAYSNKQLEEQRQEGVTYVSMGTGMICPKGKAEELLDGLEKIHRKGMDEDLAENGKAAIIKRELGNHECQLTGDVTRVVEILADYPITEEEVRGEYKEFYDECVENGWF